MFAPLLGAVRADMDRQVGWAREELRRQVRYTALIGAIGGMGALAAIGVLIVGLIALHSWLAPQVGSLAALGMIGAGLLMLILLLWPSLCDAPGPRRDQPCRQSGPRLCSAPVLTSTLDKRSPRARILCAWQPTQCARVPARNCWVRSR